MAIRIHPFLQASSFSLQTSFHSASLNSIDQSVSLTDEEKRIYQKMIDCVARFGIDDDHALFNAADYCFDTPLGTKVHNITSLQEYAECLGIDLTDDGLDAAFFANRPGGFLLTRTIPPNVYFLKVDSSDGALAYYDLQTDRFNNISELKLNGADKLVLLNKNQMPAPNACFNVHTPIEPVNGQFYHEQQEMGKCGIHACHGFLGFPAINETILSLVKLEILTHLQVQNMIYERTGDSGISLPRGQMQFYLDQMRFKLAQEGGCQAEFSNSVEELLPVLKLMAQQGSIDPKYAFLNSFEIHPIAVKQIAAILPKPWKEDDLPRILEILEARRQEFDQQFNGNLPRMEVLENQRLDMRNNGTCMTHHSEYMALMDEIQSCQQNMSWRDACARSIEGIRRLQKVFAECDRLIIASLGESHMFAMRKCQNGEWAVVDSLLSDQEHVDEPLGWLLTNIVNGYQFIALENDEPQPSSSIVISP